MNNQEQFKNSNLSVALKPDDTQSVIPVSLILQIIKDDKYYQAFVNDFENNQKIFGWNSQAVYAKAVDEFIKAVKVNNYDFALTEEHYQRINYIIENYYEVKNSLEDIIKLNKNFLLEINPEASIDLSTLYRFMKDERILLKIFNATDKNTFFNERYKGSELIYAFALLFKKLEENWNELNLDETDPELYKLMAIVNAFSNQIEDASLKFPIPEEGIIEISKHLDDVFLSILLSSKKVPLEIKKSYLSNMEENKLKSVSETMELSERNRIAKELGIWSVDEISVQRVNIINNYIQKELIDVLKTIFNGYVKEEKYNDLLNSTLFYNNIGYIYRYGRTGYSLGINDGNNITIDIETPFSKNKPFPEALLIDAITHEAIHHISKSIVGAGFKIDKQYAGINEAVTQYLAEKALGDRAYVKITREPYCYYSKTVMFIDKLVNMGIFTIDELAYNYVNNNVEYLQKSITKYVDIDTYNKIIEYFYVVNKSENASERKLAVDKLDRIIVELREKVKSKESSKKRN